ncbi:hypothetical protein M885DRAFT_557494 [Pelagophyceae sp. CCMP2097]|nr:hypothetical protein M885DRAFT_557494 [Pelagophyceae sp. CCMP2097]
MRPLGVFALLGATVAALSLTAIPKTPKTFAFPKAGLRRRRAALASVAVDTYVEAYAVATEYTIDTAYTIEIASSQPFLYDTASTLETRYAAYRTLCERAVSDATVFATFKADADYRDILEHVTELQGAMYLHYVETDYPDLLQSAPLLAAMRFAAGVGSPATFRYDAFDFPVSPTQLRYLKGYGDLRKLVGGSLSGLAVAEVGAGYGGQAQLALAESGLRSWRIYDLDCAEALAHKYISTTLPGAPFFRNGTAPAFEPPDLFISNYALAELPRSTQAPYVELACASAFGYALWNHGVHKDAINADEFVQILRDSRPDTFIEITDECPKTAPGNVLITWTPR